MKKEDEFEILQVSHFYVFQASFQRCTDASAPQ